MTAPMKRRIIGKYTPVTNSVTFILGVFASFVYLIALIKLVNFAFLGCHGCIPKHYKWYYD